MAVVPVPLSAAIGESAARKGNARERPSIGYLEYARASEPVDRAYSRVVASGYSRVLTLVLHGSTSTHSTHIGYSLVLTWRFLGRESSNGL
jgi:hypothetical protein